MSPADNTDLTRLRIDRSETTAPKRGNSPLLWIIVLAVLGYLAWERWWPTDERPAVEMARAVRTGGAAAQGGINANGYIIARKRAAISTDIQGRLVALQVEEGDRVSEGDLLARLDTRQLEASLAQAKADVERLEASVALAQLQLDRKRTLVEQGHATQEEIDVAQAELDGANASVKAAQARVDEIDVMIDKSSVYAPFSGVVILKNAEVGEVVSALGAGGANSRGAVATIVDFETLEVQVELAQTSLGVAVVDAPVHVYLDAYPERRYRGRVRQIWPTADRQKATVELRVELLERDDRVLPDLGCRVEFQPPETTGDDQIPQVYVPARAVVAGPTPQVFVVQDGQVFLKTIAITGEETNGRYAVSSGLSGRELVVIDPPASLQDGDSVRDKGADER